MVLVMFLVLMVVVVVVVVVVVQAGPAKRLTFSQMAIFLLLQGLISNPKHCCKR